MGHARRRRLTVKVDDLLVVNDAVFAATDQGLRVSTDQGKTWKSAWTGTFASGVALAADGKHVFAASDGVRRSAGVEQPWARLQVFGDAITWLTATETSVHHGLGQHRSSARRIRA